LFGFGAGFDDGDAGDAAAFGESFLGFDGELRRIFGFRSSCFSVSRASRIGVQRLSQVASKALM
jgi:hypothetical protein